MTTSSAHRLCAAVCILTAVGLGCKGAPVEELHAKALARATALTSYRVVVESEIYPAPVRIEEVADAGPAGADGGVAAMESASPFESSGGHATKRGAIGVKPTLFATLRAEAVLPDRLRVEASSTSGTLQRSLDAVYDGTTVVTVMKSGADPKQFASAAQKQLAIEGKPFDVGFTLRAFGLFDGEDYRGTVLRLLRSWTYDEVARATFDKRECFEMRGRVDVDKAGDDILGPRGALAGRVVAQPTSLEQAKQRTQDIEAAGKAIAREVRSMQYASLFVTEQGDVIGWRLGGRTGRLLEARVTSFEPNVALDAARFVIPDSTRAVARDITSMVAQQRSGPLPTMQELRTFKDQIRAEAMRGPANPANVAP